MTAKKIQPTDPKATKTPDAAEAAEADDETADRKTNAGGYGGRKSGRKTSAYKPGR